MIQTLESAHTCNFKHIDDVYKHKPLVGTEPPVLYRYQPVDSSCAVIPTGAVPEVNSR